MCAAEFGTDLFVADQAQGSMFRCPFNTPGTCATFATISGSDLLGAGPSGSSFVGDDKGNLDQVSSTGTVTVFQAGFKSARGTAYDAGHRRVFAGDHDPNGKTNFLWVLPLK